ncbi:hypothetical protein CFBP7900_07510 [Xanthomonas hortorum pv. carotae]|uniref:Uncharacterized protein n=1 Tax=Xanthomonas hortorum pv. carotae TaxID=487904 RepID=A0A6V7C5H4_9XANT|nr:hypothetical protein CFBP7900_07510 [Xanthomonas hortorum pv. carotae]CAD0310400.1 hypothetical protein CFBP7900_07510 [Xanthomonas hortorum pv. carotae]
MSLDRVRCAAIITAATRLHVHSVVLQLKAASCLRAITPTGADAKCQR